jgi:predicted transcriptional regulator YdeE
VEIETEHSSISKERTMNLTEQPEIVEWPETHYVFVERTGPFQKIAPEAWQLAYSLRPLLAENNQITGSMSLYRMSPNVYRAGFVVPERPLKLPLGLTYEIFEGGQYSKFVLTGPYSNLGPATARVFEIVAKNNMMLRMDFCIEHYVNNPQTTPEDRLITEILVPTA